MSGRGRGERSTRSNSRSQDNSRQSLPPQEEKEEEQEDLLSHSDIPGAVATLQQEQASTSQTLRDIVATLGAIRQDMTQNFEGINDRIRSIESTSSLTPGSQNRNGNQNINGGNGGSPSNSQSGDNNTSIVQDIFTNLANATTIRDWRDLPHAGNLASDTLNTSIFDVNLTPIANNQDGMDSMAASNDLNDLRNNNQLNFNNQNNIGSSSDFHNNQSSQRSNNGNNGGNNNGNGGSNPAIPQVLRDVRDNTRGASQQQVLVMRKEKECKVRITSLRLGVVAKAMKEIMEFQEREQTVVRMMQVLSSPLKAHLKHTYKIPSDTLQDMSIDSLFNIIGHETKVLGKTAFYNELKNALVYFKTSLEWKNVNLRNHEKFYMQQLGFSEDFRRLLKIMLLHNKSKCPAVNIKKNGLVRLYSEFNDSSYFQYILYDQIGKTEFKNVDDFLKSYLEAVQGHFKVSMLLREVPYSFNTEEKKEYSKYDNDRRGKFGDNKKGHRSSSYPYRNFKNKSQDLEDTELNHIHEPSYLDSDEDDDVWKDSAPDTDGKDSDLWNDDDSASVASNETQEEDQPDPEQEESETSTSDVDLLHELFHVDGGNSKQKQTGDKSKFPCMRKFFVGKCENKACPYGHSRDIMMQGAKDLKQKGEAYIRMHGGNTQPTAGGPTLLTRDNRKLKA